MPVKPQNRNKKKSAIDKLNEASDKAAKKMPGKKASAKVAAKKREKYTIS